MESSLATDEGEILDKTYRLVRLVAEGGMGLVYEATHARLAGRYAIKVLPPQWSKDPAAMARFDREARITSSLQHPNIVQIIDFNTADDGTEYLVMEYLEGETLAARLHRCGPMPLDVVVPIVEQIASGLAAAHAHGIVHRDLKPENVLLMQVQGREGDWVKILDFGISKVTGTNTDTIGGSNESLIGTPLYMAPEQCDGRTKEVDAATDQFALAVMTYEMLTGRPPFAGESIGEVLFRVLHGEPPPMNIEPGVEWVVRRGLSKSRRRRYPSVTAFAEALRAAAAATRPEQVTEKMETSGSHAYAVGELENPTLRSPARHRPFAAGLLAMAAVAAATVFFLRTAKTKPLSMFELAGVAAPTPALVVPSTTRRASERPAPPVEPLAGTAPAATVERGVADVAALARDRARDEIAEAAIAKDARETAARATGPRAVPTPVVRVARASAPRPAAAAAQRGPARPLAAPHPAAHAQPVVTPSRPLTYQPPPFRPLPPDEDAVLPLTEP